MQPIKSGLLLPKILISIIKRIIPTISADGKITEDINANSIFKPTGRNNIGPKTLRAALPETNSMGSV